MFGSFAITLKDENASSTAANRFGSAPISLSIETGRGAIYDGTGSRYRQVGGPLSQRRRFGHRHERCHAKGLAGGTINIVGHAGQHCPIFQNADTLASGVPVLSPTSCGGSACSAQDGRLFDGL